MKIRGKLDGLDAAIQAVADFDAKAARKAARAGVDDATKIVLAAVKGKVPTDTKALKKSLGRKVKTYKRGAVVYGVVGPRRDAAGKPAKFRTERVRKGRKQAAVVNPANYAHLVEFGTRPHPIGIRASKAKGKRTGANHPGAAPKPFMRPGYAESKGPAAAAVKKRLADAAKAYRPGKG